MLTVGVHASDVERRLAEGRLRCPDCAGVLAPWGHARPRVLRGEGGGSVRLRPRRTRCGWCTRTHVLLPVTSLLRRCDAVEVIGAALVARAAGAGHRTIAARLGRPAGTVRGWLRRFARWAEQVRAWFTQLAAVLDPEFVPLAPAGSPFPDAVAAIGMAAAAAVRRLGPCAPWRLVVAASNGRLLAPGWPDAAAESSNTSWPWAALW
jgi:hypothetical protein